MPPEQLQNKILELESKIQKLEANYAKHQHDSLDGTNTLRKSLKLDRDQYMQVGLGFIGADINKDGQYQFAFSTGADDARTGFVNKADLAQLDILYLAHPESPALPFSGLIGRFGIVVTSFESTSLSISSAGSTVTIDGYNFVADELEGALINIYNSSGDIIAVKTISSNTSTVVTIDGTWGATASGCKFDIYKPMYSGSSQYIWQRYYTQEGTDGGIRFGVGPTNSGSKQNGLLYMDAAGDLYWRNKAGTSTKIVRTDVEITALAQAVVDTHENNYDHGSFIDDNEADSIAQDIMDTHESTYDHSSL